MPSVKVARAGQDINCDCPQEFSMFCGTPGQGASKITVPEGVLYPLCSSGVGRQPFVEPIQQTAWDNTLSSHQVNCWLTYFPAVKYSDEQFHIIYRILQISIIIKPPFLKISQLAMFDCQSAVWQGPCRFNETTWGIPKHQPAGPRGTWDTVLTIQHGEQFPRCEHRCLRNVGAEAPSHGPSALKTLVAQNSVQKYCTWHTCKRIEIDTLSGMCFVKHWLNHLCRTVWSKHNYFCSKSNTI